MSEQDLEPIEIEPAPAVRLTFEYHDGLPRLVARQNVVLTLPEHPTPRGVQPDPGPLWMELRDAADNTVLQRPLDEHVARSREVFSPDRIERIPTPRAAGAFELLVPYVEEAESCVVLGRTEARQPSDAPRVGSQELARYRLAEIPEDEGGEP